MEKERSTAIEYAFEGMFGVIFLYYVLTQGFASILPTASAIVIFGLDVSFIMTITVLGAVLFMGYWVIKGSYEN